MSRVGDVEFNDLTYVIELFCRAPRDRGAASKARERERGAFFEGTLRDAKGQGVVGQDAGDQDTVIAQKCHLVSVLLGITSNEDDNDDSGHFRRYWSSRTRRRSSSRGARLDVIIRFL